MPNLKKVISLHQAAKISGYHQDYLSSLIRKKEIKGEKLGGNWFTTEDEIKNYIFRQKIRNKSWLARRGLLLLRNNSSFIYAFILVAILCVGIYFYNKEQMKIRPAGDETQNYQIKNLELKDKINELKF